MVAQMVMQTVKLCVVICFISSAVTAIFWNKLQSQTVQVCITSQVQTLQSQCVLCDANRYSQTSISCTGQASVPSNTTQQQAYCLINLCSNQVRQSAGFIGRKKRETDRYDQNKPIITAMTDVNEDNDDWFYSI